MIIHTESCNEVAKNNNAPFDCICNDRLQKVWRTRSKCGYNGDFIWEVVEVIGAIRFEKHFNDRNYIKCRDGSYIFITGCFHTFNSLTSDEILNNVYDFSKLIVIPELEDKQC